MPIDQYREQLALTAWLTHPDNNYIPLREDRRDRSLATHTFLDGDKGGVAYVPDTESDALTFWGKYRQDLDNGYNMYVNERVSMHSVGVFPLFFDLDFDNQQLEPREIVDICRKVREQVSRYYPDLGAAQQLQLLRTVVCWVPQTDAPPDAPPDEGSDLDSVASTASTTSAPATAASASGLKTGIHLHFPDLIVTQDQAFNIQLGVRCYLESKLGRRPDGCADWSKVVDEKVYYFPSLRALYSSKAVKCPDCNGSGSSGAGRCAGCRGRRKLHAGRRYELYSCYDGRGNRDERRNARYTSAAGKVSLLMDVSIRRPAGTQATPGFSMYRGAPQFVPLTKTGTDAQNRMFDEDRRSMNNIRRANPVHPSSKAWQLALQEIRDSCPLYAGICIKEFFKRDSKTVNMWVLFVYGDGAHSCQNMIARDHNGSSIYFTITPRGLQQRCRCNCRTTEGRRFGFCCKYASQPLPISFELRQILFPGDDSQSSHGMEAGISLEGKFGPHHQFEYLFGVHFKNVTSLQNPLEQQQREEQQSRRQDEHRRSLQQYVQQTMLELARESEDVSASDLQQIKRNLGKRSAREAGLE